MALAYSQFGLADSSMYAAYLLTHYGSSRGIPLVTGTGVSGVGTACAGFACASGKISTNLVAYLEEVVKSGGSVLSPRTKLVDARTVRGVEGESGGVCADDGRGDAAAGADVGVGRVASGDIYAHVGAAGGGAVDDVADCSVDGVVEAATNTGGDRTCSGESKRLDGVVCDSGEFVVDSGRVVWGVDSSGDVTRGKHYWKNRSKKEKKRKMSQNWRNGRQMDVGGSCLRRSEGSAHVVVAAGSRTSAEIEAAQSLAVRRVAENKVATALAAHKLRVLQDKDRTAMVDRLAAARGEQRINEAKEKSQASFKKCDQSLKSLGSSGSAGEFALKQEVKKAKDNEAIRLYVEKQAQMFAKYATPDVLQMVAAIPAPVLQDEFEAFGECPSDYGEDEQEAYFDELNRRNEENFDRCATYC